MKKIADKSPYNRVWLSKPLLQKIVDGVPNAIHVGTCGSKGAYFQALDLLIQENANGNVQYLKKVATRIAAATTKQMQLELIESFNRGRVQPSITSLSPKQRDQIVNAIDDLLSEGEDDVSKTILFEPTKLLFSDLFFVLGCLSGTG